MTYLMKKTTLMFFVIIMLLSFSANAAMPEDSSLSPLYTFIEGATCGIQIDGNTAIMDASVTADADKCQIKMTLQRDDDGDWTDVCTWTTTEDGFGFGVEETHSVTAGKDYRIKVVFKVWNGSSTESTTKYAYA